MATGRTGKPLFLTGYSKSGTTLLLALLDGHPELCVFPRETEFFTVACSELEEDREDGLQRFIDRSLVGPQFGMTESTPVDLDLGAYRNLLQQVWREGNYRISDFLAASVLAYGELTGQNGRKWWVEKTPHTERFTARIAEWYPEFKMIYVVRDPRANYAAMKSWHQREGRAERVARFAAGWERSLQACEQSRRYTKVLTIRYEDLVRSTRQVMAEVCRYLEIDFDECLLRPTLGDKPFGGNSIYGQTFNGVSGASLERWREVLPPEDIQQIEAVLHRPMRGYGYGLSRPRNPWRDLTVSGIRSRMLVSYYALSERLPPGLRQIRNFWRTISS